ncbi:hypothetical protein TMRO357_02847 [Alteriqipengyuania sp. 357]
MLQLAVPHGWMLASAQGGAVFVPCPTVSPELAALAKAGPASRDRANTKQAAHAQPMASHGHMDMGDHSAMGHTAPSADAHDKGHDGHDEGTAIASALCDFAALAAPATLPSPPLLDAPAPVADDIAPLAVRTIIPGRGLAAPPPPSTGPPITT